MEAVLTRLRDFSCRDATFDERDEPAAETCRVACPRRGGRVDIQSALAWLRRELMEMRSQDQALIRQLMDLHAGIQELKQECFLDDGEEEERCWDSGSMMGGSSTSSYSGEGSVSPSIHTLLPPLYPLFRISALHLALRPPRASNRRSSVP
ncbi:uncharacterized protein LOC143516997 [Brachyhypopomus gauderio]|uniref:uncharacterized protein LOC143516997 n=1 Tax=Brachyhypopomus gauderio TaxID=698409 RepID=UPI0040412963